MAEMKPPQTLRELRAKVRRLVYLAIATELFAAATGLYTGRPTLVITGIGMTLILLMTLVTLRIRDRSDD